MGAIFSFTTDIPNKDIKPIEPSKPPSKTELNPIFPPTNMRKPYVKKKKKKKRSRSRSRSRQKF